MFSTASSGSRTWGIPVIVTEQGGPAENIVPGETGLVVPGDCARSIFTAMASLVADSRRRSAMGKAARQYMESRSFEAAFDETWEMVGALNADKMAAAG